MFLKETYDRLVSVFVWTIQLPETKPNVCASKVWNNLPKARKNCTSVNAFKKALKTHFFLNKLFSMMFIFYYVCLLFFHFCKRPEPFGNGVSNTCCMYVCRIWNQSPVPLTLNLQWSWSIIQCTWKY